MFKSLLVVVKMLVKVVGSWAEVMAAKKLNLEEAVAVMLFVVVLAMGLALDMEKDLPMMEEEKGGPYL